MDLHGANGETIFRNIRKGVCVPCHLLGGLGENWVMGVTSEEQSKRNTTQWWSGQGEAGSQDPWLQDEASGITIQIS